MWNITIILEKLEKEYKIIKIEDCYKGQLYNDYRKINIFSTS